MVAVLQKNDVFKIFKSFQFFFYPFFWINKTKKKRIEKFSIFFFKIFPGGKIAFFEQKIYFLPPQFGNIFTQYLV
jgi:hypothetical protein